MELDLRHAVHGVVEVAPEHEQRRGEGEADDGERRLDGAPREGAAHHARRRAEVAYRHPVEPAAPIGGRRLGAHGVGGRQPGDVPEGLKRGGDAGQQG